MQHPGLQIEFGSTLVGVWDTGYHEEDWPVYLRLSSGKVYGADIILSCIGVVPNSAWLGKESGIELAEDGGIRVSENMQQVLLMSTQLVMSLLLAELNHCIGIKFAFGHRH